MVNEAFVECGYDCDDNFNASLPSHRTALRAVQERKAFAQEVSDYLTRYYQGAVPALLRRLIIAKPDPLADIIRELRGDEPTPATEWANELRIAIAKRNGRIVFDDRDAAAPHA